VFPVDRKAAPLLRGWVRRLKEQGVRLHANHRWIGWSNDGALRFATEAGEIDVHADATVLAMGAAAGRSWAVMAPGSPLQARGVDIAPLQSANCGFDIDWTPFFAQRNAGAPLKPVVAHWIDLAGQPQSLQGECVASEYGIEGSLIYALAADLRETINRDGHAMLWLDLVPGRDEARLLAELSRPRKGAASVSTCAARPAWMR
jgi:predicted flavoprotein YhiN